MPPLPKGRKWRSGVSPFLHTSFYHGLVDYQYRGVPMQKHPIEVALYQQLIWETKPRTIIEIGSLAGGSAIWMGDMLNTFGIDGRVISLDLNPSAPDYKPANVTFLKGDANDLGGALTSDFLASLPRPWLVIEDASHHFESTFAVLKFFDPLLRRGEFIVVEDGNVSEMGVDGKKNGGPARAIAEFLQTRSEGYEIDASYCDRYGRNVTGNPNGYLRKL